MKSIIKFMLLSSVLAAPVFTETAIAKEDVDCPMHHKHMAAMEGHTEEMQKLMSQIQAEKPRRQLVFQADASWLSERGW